MVGLQLLAWRVPHTYGFNLRRNAPVGSCGMGPAGLRRISWHGTGMFSSLHVDLRVPNDLVLATVSGGCPP